MCLWSAGGARSRMEVNLQRIHNADIVRCKESQTACAIFVWTYTNGCHITYSSVSFMARLF